MPSNYPTGLDAFTTGTLTGVVAGADHGNKADAINKIEAELGIGPSGQAATVAARLANVPVSVKDYGAIGDGTADDTSEIQAAVDAADGEVFFPPGTYKVTSAITLPYGSNGLVLRGAGAGLTGAAATTISYTGGAAYVFKIGGNTSGNFARWQFIEDMEIVGNASAFGCVEFASTRWCGIRRCYIRNFTASGAVGIILEGNAGTTIPNYFNQIEHCYIDNCPHGIYMRGETSGTGANSNIVSHCSIANCGTAGVLIDGGDTNRILLCEFDNNTGLGIQITGANTAALYNMVAFCQFDSGNGVTVTNAAASLNQVLHNSGPSFALTDTGTDTKFEGLFGYAVPSIASAGTVTLKAGDFFSISGTTTITSVTASWAGRRVTLTFQGALTFTDGSNLKLAGNFVTTADDTITLVSDGTNWYETGRSIN